MSEPTDPERQRLRAMRSATEDWRGWGPYVSERQWGTVREDYSAGGTAWDHFTHDHARSRAYRWGEDGIAGFCDDRQLLCLSLALWNGKDPILKERLFGLTNQQGNHGEDVKELYYYVDAVPSHAYGRMLYKLTQAAYPYQWLIDENARRKGTSSARIRTDRHRPVRSGPLLRRGGGIRQGIPDRYPDAHHRAQSRTGHRADPYPAASLVSQCLELVQRCRAPGHERAATWRGRRRAQPTRSLRAELRGPRIGWPSATTIRTSTRFSAPPDRRATGRMR